jgi:toxin ParE1/3/4
MSHAKWTSRAVRDIEDIAFFIAVNDGRPDTAKQIVVELKERAEFYAKQPSLGQARPDLVEGIFCGRHKRWLIFYEPSRNGIIVHRVIDGSRDYPRLF